MEIIGSKNFALINLSLIPITKFPTFDQAGEAWILSSLYKNADAIWIHNTSEM